MCRLLFCDAIEHFYRFGKLNFQQMKIMYRSLRVECTEGEIQSMGNVPPVGFGPASMKPLNLQIQSGMGTSITAKGDRLTKFSAEFPIVFAYVNGTHFVHETGPSTGKM